MSSASPTFWVDGTQQTNLTDLNNSNRRVDLVRWGPVEGMDTGTRGTCCRDDFEALAGRAPTAVKALAHDK